MFKFVEYRRDLSLIHVTVYSNQCWLKIVPKMNFKIVSKISLKFTQIYVKTTQLVNFYDLSMSIRHIGPIGSSKNTINKAIWFLH